MSYATAGLAVCVLAASGACLPIDVVPLPDAGPETGGIAVALAGPDLTVIEGARVRLSALSSRVADSSGQTSSPAYAWTQTDGPAVLLSNPTAAEPMFTAPLAPASLAFTVTLTGAGAQSADTVRVEVRAAAAPAGAVLTSPADGSARVGDTVIFPVSIVGATMTDAELVAFTTCGGSAAVENGRVTATVPALPCAIVVDGVASTGGALTGVAPTARVMFPEGVGLVGTLSLDAPLVVEPAQPVTVRSGGQATDGETRFFVLGGSADVFDGERADVAAFNTPRRVETLLIAAERRRGGASSGLALARIQVTAGAGNVAPLGRAGPDRQVRPGASFRVDAKRSSDADGDALTLMVTQKLGGEAAVSQLAPNVFTAPASDGELLFWVTADDGTVVSQPDTVRVSVRADAANLPPVLNLPATLYVTPHAPFSIDASGAEDPDSGVIATTLIGQDASDAEILLSEPVDTPAVELVAGDAGARYHFTVTVGDADQLLTTAHVEVVVESAGPYVDPVRGLDATANGTPALPFATVAAALPTAVRHRFPQLRLAAGDHGVLDVEMPEGLGIAGGYLFDGAGYSAEGTSALTLTSALVLRDSTASALTATIAGAGSIACAGSVVLVDVTITGAPAQDGTVLAVGAGASAVLENVRVLPSATTAAAPAVVVDAGAVLQADATLIAPAGGAGNALVCTDAAVRLGARSAVRGPPGGTGGTGMVATRCSVEIANSTVAGGGSAAFGLVMHGGLVVLDADGQLAGTVDAGAAALAATALTLTDDATASLAGELFSASGSGAPGEAHALVQNGGSAELRAAHVVAFGDTATAVSVVDGELVISQSEVHATGSSGAGLVGTPHRLTVADSSVIAAGDGVAIGTLAFEQGTALQWETSVATSTGAGLVITGDIAVSKSSFAVVYAGPMTGTPTVGLQANGGALSRSTVEVTAPDAVAFQGTAGLAVGGTLVVDSCRFTALGSERARAAVLSSQGAVTSSILRAAGEDSVVVAATESLRADFITLIGDGVGIAWNPSDEAGPSGLAELAVTNSVLLTPVGIVTPAPVVANALGSVVFDDGAVCLRDDTEDVLTLQRLLERGCTDCLLVALEPLLSADGHLQAGDNPLVDAADVTTLVAADVDGDPRVQGDAPDLGADEAR